MQHLLILLLVVGCGRLGFDAPAEDAPVAPADTSGPPDDAPGDAPGDTTFGRTVTVSFGEAPGTDVMNATSDTFISQEAGETLLNYGADDELRIERDVNERGLLRFELTAIPATATVLTATIDLTVTELPAGTTQLQLSRMLESWTEGTGQGTSGSASYINRSGTIPWLVPGAGPPLSSTAVIAGSSPALGRATYPVDTSVVQLMVTSPATNHGFLLTTNNDDSTRIVSSEGTPASDRPVLTVTYVP